MIPAQKAGIDCPKRARVIPIRSKMVPLLMAEIDPQGQGDADRKKGGHKGKIKTRRNPFQEQLHGRLLVPKGHAEIAPDDFADINSELDVHGAIEPEIFRQIGPLLG